MPYSVHLSKDYFKMNNFHVDAEEKIEIKLRNIKAKAYKVPTDKPESDGTIKWDSTTIVIVEAEAAGYKGIGYTYTHSSAAELINDKLSAIIKNKNAMNIEARCYDMLHEIRNIGRPGLVSACISAIDISLYDLKAKILGIPVVSLIGEYKNGVEIYGSGGFTSYTISELQEQLSGWVNMGITRVKMKIGRDPSKDVERVKAAREAIGNKAELFVDANGAYTKKQALSKAMEFFQFGVSWYEEPVSSDDLQGLRILRERVPAPIEITAGEYGYDYFYFKRMLDAGSVDVLQADGTRCGGITGFLKANVLCEAANIPLSAHTAPAVHMHAGSCAKRLRHIEYFHDHARIERIFFDGFPRPYEGRLIPDKSRPGLGFELRKGDIEKFEV